MTGSRFSLRKLSIGVIFVVSSFFLGSQFALAQRSPLSVEEAVVQLTASNSPASKIAIIRELASRGPAARDAVPVLTSELKNMDRPTSESRDTVSEIAAEALGAVGPNAVSAIPTLIWAGDHTPSLLDLSEHDTARRPYVRAVVQMGESAFPPLLGLTSQEGLLSETTINILSSIGDKAIPFLVATLESADMSKAKGVAKWMPGIQDAATVSALVKLFAHSNNTVAQYAVVIVSAGIKIAGEIHQDPAPLITELAKGLSSSNPVVRAWTCYALGGSGPASKAALPSLRRLSADPDPKVRSYASAAVTKINAELLNESKLKGK